MNKNMTKTKRERRQLFELSKNGNKVFDDWLKLEQAKPYHLQDPKLIENLTGLKNLCAVASLILAVMIVAE